MKGNGDATFRDPSPLDEAQLATTRAIAVGDVNVDGLPRALVGKILEANIAAGGPVGVVGVNGRIGMLEHVDIAEGDVFEESKISSNRSYLEIYGMPRMVPTQGPETSRPASARVRFNPF